MTNYEYRTDNSIVCEEYDIELDGYTSTSYETVPLAYPNIKPGSLPLDTISTDEFRNTFSQTTYSKRYKRHTDGRAEIPENTTLDNSGVDLVRIGTRSRLNVPQTKTRYSNDIKQQGDDTLHSVGNLLTEFCFDFAPSHSRKNHLHEINDGLQNLALEDKHTYWEQILQPDSDGDNLLFIAIILQLTEISLMFIGFIPDFNLLKHSNAIFQTALHLAVLTENQQLTRRLVVAGVEVDKRDWNGNTALHIACQRGNMSLAYALMSPVTYVETKQNSYEIPYQKIPQHLEIRNSDGMTCLLIAAMNNDLEMMELLLSKDADINAVDMKNGKSCLHIFAERGNVSLIKFLMSKQGLNVNAGTYAGFSAAELAHYRGHTFVVAQLLYAGTNPNIRSLDSKEFQADDDSDYSDDDDSDSEYVE